MKEKSYVARLGALALALTLISTCLMGGTLAKYTTEVTATGTATVAKWNFTVTNPNGQPFTLNLTPNTYKNVANNKLAPGTSGSFAIVATNDSDVAATYSITFETETAPKNLKFYKSTDGTTPGDEIKVENDNKTYKAFTDEALGIGNDITKYVMWEWPFSTSADLDKEDVADSNQTMTVKVTVTGTQAEPEKQAPAP